LFIIFLPELDWLSKFSQSLLQGFKFKLVPKSAPEDILADLSDTFLDLQALRRS